jgi:hypothetical protein
MMTGANQSSSCKVWQIGHYLALAPDNESIGNGLRDRNVPQTGSLERLPYVGHAFQRAGSGGFQPPSDTVLNFNL